VVLLLGLHENDAKEKRKVLKAVSTFPGGFAFLYPLKSLNLDGIFHNSLVSCLYKQAQICSQL
jgi:hypothetical protein